MIDTPRNFQPIPTAQFLALGLPEVAYIKDIKMVSGDHVISLCAANGQQIAIAKDKQQAQQIALQNGLIPLTVH